MDEAFHRSIVPAALEAGGAQSSSLSAHSPAYPVWGGGEQTVRTWALRQAPRQPLHPSPGSLPSNPCPPRLLHPPNTQFSWGEADSGTHSSKHAVSPAA
jgi:hypothetical protein